jgi:hypothetical protein
MLMLLSTFVALWIGYLAFPTLGPRVPPALEGQVLGGTGISHAIRATLRVLERNVFLFSTVYLSLHYVVDVLGGALLAGMVAGIFGLSRRANWSRRRVARERIPCAPDRFTSERLTLRTARSPSDASQRRR